MSTLSMSLAAQVVSYARLTDRLDGGTPFTAAQILLPNAASWLFMAASAVPLAWALRKRVRATGVCRQQRPCKHLHHPLEYHSRQYASRPPRAHGLAAACDTSCRAVWRSCMPTRLLWSVSSRYTTCGVTHVPTPWHGT